MLHFRWNWGFVGENLDSSLEDEAVWRVEELVEMYFRFIRFILKLNYLFYLIQLASKLLDANLEYISASYFH